MDGVRKHSRVLVAMSGGVDSSVAAALVKAGGHEVVGVWMRLSEVADSYSEFNRSCCSLDAAEDARRVASQLDIPFYILNLEREFEVGVLQPFLDGYLGGTTPSPCVDCNVAVKFGALMGQARLLYDCDAVATGHYARIDESSPGDEPGTGTVFRLRRGADPSKDQSYFLYGLGQEELAHTIFPLGGMPKTEVRERARSMGLVTAEKRDSQEICFVPRGNYRDVLRERAGWQAQPGPLVDMDGLQVGEHAGSAGYTVGQRQGVGVALGEPRYVWKIEPGENRVTLGRRSDLETRRFEVEKVRFVAGSSPADGDPGFTAMVQIRHRARPAPAKVHPGTDGRWVVETEDPVWAAAPGQAAVFYRGDEVVGGGRIARPRD
jgi:tRNA-specific 2-thiouridylase